MLGNLKKLSTDVQNEVDNLECVVEKSNEIKNKYKKYSNFSNIAEEIEKELRYIKNFAEIKSSRINESKINEGISNKNIVK